jgi:hypothetical protein
MKNTFQIVLLLFFSLTQAQKTVDAKTKKDTTQLLNFEYRWYNTSPCGCYTFPKKDSIYIPRDTIKQHPILFNSRTKLFKTKKPLRNEVVLSFLYLKL